MSVKIRLQRLGRKKRPFYRIVAIDSKKRRDGLEIERLGWYDPIAQDNLSIKLDEEKTKYRIGDKIDGTNMIIESCNQDSMIVNVQSDKKFTSNKDSKFRIFYMSSEQK